MSVSITVTEVTMQQWVVEKRDIQELREELLSQGMEEGAVAGIIKEYRKLKNAKRQFAGFVMLATGAFLGFISCVLTLINPIPELYNLILFGLTSVAILIIIAGLYYLLE